MNPQEAIRMSLQTIANAGIVFENASRYNTAIRSAFFRTMEDIDRLSGRRSLRILEVRSFKEKVSLALKAMCHDVTASDMHFVLNDAGVRRLLDEAGIPKVAADLSRIPFCSKSADFDLVVFKEVLEHLNFNPLPLLGEFQQILKPNGLLYCAPPHLSSAKNRWLVLAGRGYLNPVHHLKLNLKPESGTSIGLHWREWTKAKLVEIFECCGFRLK